jgi:hypothetical protein
MIDSPTWIEMSKPPGKIYPQRTWVVLSTSYEFIVAVRASTQAECFDKLGKLRTAISHWHMIIVFDDDGVRLLTINRVDIDQLYAKKNKE